jgi:hypothetical protein
MANIIITATGGSVLVTQTGAQNPRKRSFVSLSTSLGVDSINFYEGGVYKCKFSFNDFNSIGGVVPSSLENANQLILNLIPN